MFMCVCVLFSPGSSVSVAPSQKCLSLSFFHSEFGHQNPKLPQAACGSLDEPEWWQDLDVKRHEVVERRHDQFVCEKSPRAFSH